jgi:hypothetical protein
MDRYASNNFARSGVEGNFNSIIANKAIETSANLGGLPVFQRFVVEEVIFDPLMLDDARIKSIVETYKLTDKIDIARLPRNTIIGKQVIDGAQSGTDASCYLLPFFPPHLSLPVSAGEHVWVFYDNVGRQSSYGYWICRIPELRHVDDINHTHADRKFHNIENGGTIARATGNAQELPPSFDNGATILKNGSKVSDSASASISGGIDAYAKIIKNSDAGKITELEDVPRWTKRPGDLVLQGTNNALISIGTDRVGPPAEIETTQNGRRAKGKPKSDKTGKSGTIDMVVGRGKGKTKVKTVKNTLGQDEIDKKLSNENRVEGDPNFEDDAGRIYLSMRTDADNNFNIGVSNINQSGEGSAAVIKVDQVRLIARNDVKILVESDGGSAAVVIKKSGDIVFVPSSNGVVKLGGDGANIALLGIQSPAAGGTVVAPPMVSTMGGSVGAGAGNGVYATKVLAL